VPCRILLPVQVAVCCLLATIVVYSVRPRHSPTCGRLRVLLAGLLMGSTTYGKHVIFGNHVSLQEQTNCFLLGRALLAICTQPKSCSPHCRMRCCAQVLSYPENSVGRPLPMEADPDAMHDKDEVCLCE